MIVCCITLMSDIDNNISARTEIDKEFAGA